LSDTDEEKIEAEVEERERAAFAFFAILIRGMSEGKNYERAETSAKE